MMPATLFLLMLMARHARHVAACHAAADYAMLPPYRCRFYCR